MRLLCRPAEGGTSRNDEKSKNCLTLTARSDKMYEMLIYHLADTR